MSEPRQPTVEIDRMMCIGAGDCVRRAPGAFALDDGGTAVIVDLTTVDIETLRAVERSCPSGAITVSD